MNQCRERAAIDLFTMPAHFEEWQEGMPGCWFYIKHEMISWAQLGWAGAEVCAWLWLTEQPLLEPSLSLHCLWRCPGCMGMSAAGAAPLHLVPATLWVFVKCDFVFQPCRVSKKRISCYNSFGSNMVSGTSPATYIE